MVAETDRRKDRGAARSVWRKADEEGNFAAVIVLIFSTPISKFDHGSLRGHHADLV